MTMRDVAELVEWQGWAMRLVERGEATSDADMRAAIAAKLATADTYGVIHQGTVLVGPVQGAVPRVGEVICLVVGARTFDYEVCSVRHTITGFESSVSVLVQRKEKASAEALREKRER